MTCGAHAANAGTVVESVTALARVPPTTQQHVTQQGDDDDNAATRHTATTKMVSRLQPVSCKHSSAAAGGSDPPFDERLKIDEP